jgi:phosphatidate cytidylyltransferase
MALPLGSAKPDVLVLRIVSAAVLAPVAIAAVWLGGAYLAVVALSAAAAMGWEWSRMTRGGRFGLPGTIVVATEVIGVGAAALGSPAVGVALVLAGTGVAALASAASSASSRIWLALGALWIGLPSIALLWIAGDPQVGRATILWLLALVWAVDSAAFVVGKLVGGPALAPRWSPKKTWSGAVGGVAAAAVVGMACGKILGYSIVSSVVWTSLGLSVVEQMGDLAESAAKRRFGVKDASTLIPGHGGFLDRLDGMLAVLAVTAIMVLVYGKSPLAWG